MQRVTRLLGVFVAWTIVVWVGRVRNVLGDDDLTTLDRSWRLVVAATFLAFAGLLVAVFCLWTTAFWGVRGFGMLFGDHDAGFKLVHTALALVSIALALRLHRLDRDAARHLAPAAGGARPEEGRGDLVHDR